MKSPAEYRSLADRLKTIHHECLDAEIRSATWGAADALDGIAQALEQDRAVKEYCGACGATINSRAHALQFAAAQQEIAELKHDLTRIYEADAEHLAENATLRRKLELCERDAEACVCKGNWREILKECDGLIGKDFVNAKAEKYVFFGLVHGDDDYYYGMWREGHLHLLSCVGDITGHGYTLADSQREGT